MYKLGIDIGGTKVNIGLLDEKNNIVLKQAENIEDDKDYRSVLNWIKKKLDILLLKNSISYQDIQSCGMGIPGTVSADGRVAVKVPNLGWDRADIAKEFEKLTGIATILTQDSKAAAFGEYKMGNGTGKQIVVCVTLGTGIGIGIVMNGKVFNGALGSAGESGHNPVVANGRACGCGKKGCLGSYVAGKGLDTTAKEVFGKEYSAKDIFEFAKTGNEKAKRILEEVTWLLGNELVAIVNLISPDCLLFSGGMSKQTDLLINPLTAYIFEHSYSIPEGKRLSIGLAKLGADSPMVGAALMAESHSVRKPKLSASVMCADMLHMKDDFLKLEQAGIDYLHWDIMDGHFVPNLMLSMKLINKARSGTKIPYDIHLMAEKPEDIIPLLHLKEGDIVSVHWESTPHVQRALSLIKEKGATAALAINPSTPIECVRDLLDDIQVVLIMTVNPGYAGQKIVPQSYDKITRMRNYLDDLGYHDIIIEVDGNCSFENAPKMHSSGAELFVVGSSSVFDPQLGIYEGAKRLYSVLQ